jgi:hypothetical protein
MSEINYSANYSVEYDFFSASMRQVVKCPGCSIIFLYLCVFSVCGRRSLFMWVYSGTKTNKTRPINKQKQRQSGTLPIEYQQNGQQQSAAVEQRPKQRKVENLSQTKKNDAERKIAGNGWMHSQNEVHKLTAHEK